jgi:hypothetical protein
MKANVPMIMLFMALFSSQACDGCKVDPIRGTRESGDKVYSGDKNATAPYAKTVSAKTKQEICTQASCTYSIVARVMLHNPLPGAVTVDVDCVFTSSNGEYEAGKNHRHGVKVSGNSSKAVEIQQMIGITEEGAQKVGASCEATFR